MLRRRLLSRSAGLLASLLAGCAATRPEEPATNPAGSLLLVGGAEDRFGERAILRRFAAICGGTSARVLLLSAASGFPERVWQGYEPVLQSVGLQDSGHLDLRSAEQADDAQAARILAADGIYISGGDQRRLMATLRGTACERALQQAWRRGCCIAGTSAGASALAREMLAGGGLWQPNPAALEPGLGLLPQALVDQHFSQRRRLPRLLGTLQRRPELVGVGIDEDTALLIEPGRAIEVLGSGSVTLARADASELHRLAAGSRHALVVPEPDPALRESIARLLGICSFRS